MKVPDTRYCSRNKIQLGSKFTPASRASVHTQRRRDVGGSETKERDAGEGGSKKVLFDTLPDILNNTTAAEYAAPRYIASLAALSYRCLRIIARPLLERFNGPLRASFSIQRFHGPSECRFFFFPRGHKSSIIRSAVTEK